MMKINKVSIDENILLRRLQNIAKKPHHLYIMGSLPETEMKAIAIVGSRRPTAYGRAITEQISEALARRGVYIISGMALGVDGIAHKAALEVGGHTIAVLPSGVDTPYPKTNHDIARRILQGGDALISEYEPGYVPRLYDFVLRSRIVTGLSDALIITEANIRSGTMSTVTYALEQGKPVYAVPGPITSPLSAGCNKLIAQGAIPITSVEELIINLGLDSNSEAAPRGDTPLEQLMLDLIHEGIHDGDQLLEQSKSAPEEFSGALTMLEIKGMIKPLGNNQWRL